MLHSQLRMLHFFLAFHTMLFPYGKKYCDEEKEHPKKENSFWHYSDARI